MYVYLSKILPLFVLPLGIVFLFGLIGLLLLKWDHWSGLPNRSAWW